MNHSLEVLLVQSWVVTHFTEVPSTVVYEYRMGKAKKTWAEFG